MNKKTALLILLAFATPSTFADEVSVFPRASLGLATTSVDIPVRGSVPVITNGTYWTLGLGGTVLSEPYFAKADVSLGFAGGHDMNNVKGDLSRNEFSITGGRKFLKSYELFGGYRSARSKFETSAGATTLTELGSQGFFVGATGFMVFNQATRVSASVTINYLEGELTDNRGAGASYGAKSKPGVGYGVGADWSTPITDRLRLSAEVKNEFNNHRGWSDPNNPGLPAVQESNFSLFFGLSYLY